MERRQPRLGGRGIPLRGLLVPAWILGGATLILLRQPGIPAVDTIWAEDGEIFLTDALLASPLRTLAAPYAGYLNLLPRLMAGVVSLFPIAWASTLLAVAGALAVSALSAYVFVASRELLVTRLARSLLAVMVLLLPAAGWESLNNVTNLQWSLLLPCLVALLAPTSAGVVASGVVGFVAASSSPITLVLLPIAVHRFLRPPSGNARIVAIAYLVGALLQIAVSAITAENPLGVSTDPLALPWMYGLRVAGSVVAGDWILPWAWSTLGFWSGFVALGIAVVIVAVGSAATRSLAPLAVAGLSFVLFAVPVVVRGTSLLAPLPGNMNLAVGSKWVVGPSLVLLMGILLGIDPNLHREAMGRWRIPSLALALGLTAMLGVSAVAGFRVPNERVHGPRWSEGIRSAARACGPDEEVTLVPVAPSGWSAAIPCRRIADDQGLVATTSIWRPNSGHRNLSER